MALLLLKQDHIQEIVDKWRSIDDEIWAKIICMERNRRIAKAYARKHTILVDGSKDDYLDGTTLGLNSFDNPDRDPKTSYMKQHIGEVSANILRSNLIPCLNFAIKFDNIISEQLQTKLCTCKPV